MILESVFNLFSSALKLIFGWINLPQLPAEVETVINQLFQYMESGIGFLYLFFNMSLVKIMLPFVLVVSNFEKVYKLVMYVLRKIPFLGIE
ncbi:hypothetical protein LIZ87_10175 [Lacrimispora sp. 210928-DFI.3.58]|nr:hypothetical protein [Lacrimispora sp. 210928-DFI.3.58]